MVIDFGGKVAVVTGGAGGIGSAIVKELLKSNAKVALLGHSQASVDKAAESMKELGTVKGYALDMNNVASFEGVVNQIQADLGPIEYLAQAAGLMAAGSGLDLTPEEWDRLMNVNSRGLYFLMQAVIKCGMKETGGAIVNISSMAGVRGMDFPLCSAHYSASKAAVVGVTMQGAVEWAPLGIRVNAIAPGGVRTGMMAVQEPPEPVVAPVPMKKLSWPEDIANAVCFLLSDKAAMITGQTLIVDGGASVVGH